MRTFILLLAIVLASCAGQHATPSPAREVSRIETAPGVTLYVEKYGDGANVVIVPGRLFLANEFRALASPDRTLVMYDMRNRGASSSIADGALLSIAHDVEDLEALREHFRAERISVIGYSYLGLMVALYAAEHPDRVERLVQLGPVPRRWNTDYPPELRAGPDSLSEEGREAMRAWEAAQEGSASDQAELCAIQLRSTAYYVVGNPENAALFPNTCVYENEWPANFDRHLGFHFGDIRSQDFPATMFSGLSVPVLTVHGTLDRNAPYGGGVEWARTFPNGRLITVTGAAHQVWLDDPSVITDVDAFLRGDWPARSQSLHERPS